MHVSTPIIYKVISLYYMSLSYTNHKLWYCRNTNCIFSFCWHVV